MTTHNPTRTAHVGGQDKVLTALAALGRATARQIADHTGLGYSTVTERLRKLAEAGTVHNQPAGTGPTSWRPAGPAAGTDNQPEQGNQPEPAEPAVEGGDETEPDQAMQEVTGPTESEPGTGPDPVPAAAPPAEDPAGDGATGDATHQEPTTAPTGPDATPAGGEPGTRRPPGKLREQVLGVLRTHAEDSLTPHQISKLLDGASSGAIVLACRKLAYEGSAKQVLAKPETFQAE